MEHTMNRLTRSRRDRVFGGVCGGLAEYLGWDVVLVRVAWVGLTVLSAGIGIPLYLLAWIIVPTGTMEIEEMKPTVPRSNTRAVLGILLFVVGLLALSGSILPWFWKVSGIKIVGPLLLIVAGAFLLLRRGVSPASDPNRNPNEVNMTAGSETDSRPLTARRLVRIHKGRKIAGVCTGLGDYFNMDPTVVRLLWLALVLAYGMGLLLYLILWLVVPLETERYGEQTKTV